MIYFIKLCKLEKFILFATVLGINILMILSCSNNNEHVKLDSIIFAIRQYQLEDKHWDPPDQLTNLNKKWFSFTDIEISEIESRFIIMKSGRKGLIIISKSDNQVVYDSKIDK